MLHENLTCMARQGQGCKGSAYDGVYTWAQAIIHLRSCGPTTQAHKCAMRSLYKGISDDKSRISHAEKRPVYFGLEFVGLSVHEASNVRPCHHQTLIACTVSALFFIF